VAPIERGTRKPKAAHTWDNEVTETVFHMATFSLKAAAEENA
jgi:hypothetical protein